MEIFHQLSLGALINGILLKGVISEVPLTSYFLHFAILARL